MNVPDRIRIVICRPRAGCIPAGPGQDPGAGAQKTASPETEPAVPPSPAAGQAAEPPADPGSMPDLEIAEQMRIAGLWKDHWLEYVMEEYRFRVKYHKSCKCDVCGEFRKELFRYRNRTYCPAHLPVDQRQAEGRVKAKRHGELQSILRKLP